MGEIIDKVKGKVKKTVGKIAGSWSGRARSTRPRAR